MSKLFRPRGTLSNDSRYAVAARVMSLEQMLSFRDTWTEPPCEGFNVFQIIKDARTVVPAPKAELVTTENGWHVSDKASMSEVEIAVRGVQSSLNRLTERNFDTICGEILALKNILDPEVIPKIVKRFFDKALDEPVFAEQYSRLCFELARFEGELNSKNGVGQTSQIRASIINAAQHVFEQEDSFNSETSTDEQRDVFRKRKINNIKFVAELFKQQMISRKIISHILTTKFMTANVPSESDAEVTCELLASIGAHLERTSGDQTIEPVFTRAQELIDQKVKPYSNRVKFMLMNLLDLRAKGWKKVERIVEDNCMYQDGMTSAIAASNANPAPSSPAGPGGAATFSAGAGGRGGVPVSNSSANLVTVGSNAALGSGNAHVDPNYEEKAKAYSLAMPPSVDEAVEKKIVSAFLDAVSQARDVADREAKLTEVVGTDVPAILSMIPPRDARTAAVCFLTKAACTTSKDDTRSSIVNVIADSAVWKDKNELFRGISWCFVSCVADDILADCPRVFERFVASVLVRFITDKQASFVTLTKDVFGRTANYLDAVSQYDPCLYSAEWEVQFTETWERLVSKLPTIEGALPLPAGEVLDQLSTVKVSDFLARAIPDLVGSLTDKGVCTAEDLKKWVAEKQATTKGKNDDRVGRVVFELQHLFI